MAALAAPGVLLPGMLTHVGVLARISRDDGPAPCVRIERSSPHVVY